MKKCEQIGIMLSLGFTKKEIAAKTGRSVNTIDNQAQSLYRETGSRNLADITRHMISRYSGIPSEDILINALHDITIGLAVAFVTWVALQPEVAEKVNSAFSTVANYFYNIL